MRRALPFALSLMALALVARAQTDTGIARLVTYQGEVDVVRAGVALTLAPDLPLSTGDSVSSRDGRAVVRFTDGSEIRIRPKTRIVLSDRPGGREIEVFWGRLWAFVQSGSGRATNFKTGGTIAGVRGTKLEYAANDDKSQEVGAIDDPVGVESVRSDGRGTCSFELRAGERIRVLPGGGLGDPAPFREGDIAGPELGGAGPGEPDFGLKRVVPVRGNNPYDPQDPAASGSPSGTPTPSPDCLNRSETCDPNDDHCCRRLTCQQSGSGFICSTGSTPTPTPTATATPTPSATPTATPTSTPLSGGCLALTSGYDGDNGCGLGLTHAFVSGNQITLEPFGSNGPQTFTAQNGTASSNNRNLVILGAPGHSCMLQCSSGSAGFAVVCQRPGASCGEIFRE
jgi:hypothetical protein